MQDANDIVKLIQESIFEACYSEMGQYSGGGGMGMPAMPSAPKHKGKEVDPNNVSLLSIPKQTKFFGNVNSERKVTENITQAFGGRS